MPILGTNGSAAAVYHDIDTLPAPEARTRGTLLSVARPIPLEQLQRNGANRMLAGVTWTPWPDVIVNRAAVGCDEVYTKDARDVPGLASQAPFLLWDRLQCSTAGLEISWLADALRLGLYDLLSAQFALELEDAAGSGGIGLVGNATYTPTVVASGAVGLDVAIAELEGYLAEQGGAGKPGMRGVIHLTPGLLTIALADGLIEWMDGRYCTATGTVVIGDAGHTGQDTPHGQSAAGSGQAWIYATGDVFWAVGQSPNFTVTDPTDPDGGPVYVGQNKNRPLDERAGLVVFDPNVLGTALVTVGSSDGGDSSGGDASASYTYTQTAIAEGAIASAERLNGFRVYNAHASDAVLIYIRHGDQATDTPISPLAIAAGQSVNVFDAIGEPVGEDGVYITDESAGSATISDLVGYITTSAGV